MTNEEMYKLLPPPTDEIELESFGLPPEYVPLPGWTDLYDKTPEGKTRVKWMGAELEELVGARLITAMRLHLWWQHPNGMKPGGWHPDGVLLFTSKGIFYVFHEQDCCEAWSIEHFTGFDPRGVGEVIEKAEWLEPTEEQMAAWEGREDFWTDESWTWAFLSIQTNSLDISGRFFCTSNGYYSERTQLARLRNFPSDWYSRLDEASKVFLDRAFDKYGPKEILGILYDSLKSDRAQHHEP